MQNLTTNHTTNVSVVITWLPPQDANGIISFYQVNITNDNINASLPEIVEIVGATIAVFIRLRPFSNYTVGVRPVTANGSIAGLRALLNFTTDIGSEFVASYMQAF